MEKRGRDLGRSAYVYRKLRMGKRELDRFADQVVWSAHRPPAGFVSGDHRERRLVGPLGQLREVRTDLQRGSTSSSGRHDGRFIHILTNGEEGHPSTVDSPIVYDHGVELGGHARLEDPLDHPLGDTVAVVDHDKGTDIPIS